MASHDWDAIRQLSLAGQRDGGDRPILSSSDFDLSSSTGFAFSQQQYRFAGGTASASATGSGTVSQNGRHRRRRDPRLSRLPSHHSNSTDQTLSSSPTSEYSTVTSSSYASTSITAPSLDPGDTWFPVRIPCEWHQYGQCPASFHSGNEWYDHCCRHWEDNNIPFPRDTSCWYCDEHHFYAELSNDPVLQQQNAIASYERRMGHIAWEWANDPRRERIRRDQFVIQHLQSLGLMPRSVARSLARSESSWLGRWQRENINTRPPTVRPPAVVEVASKSHRQARKKRHH